MAIAERELTARAPSAEEAPDASSEWTPPPYRWTREQFYQMGDVGLFEGRRAILVEGEILAIPAMGYLHKGVLILTSDALRDVFGADFFVSVQCPFDVGQATDPEPDIAIIRGSVRDYLNRGMTEAALIVEVSDATLGYDRGGKARLYASTGVEDYWIINVQASQVEVHRRPLADGQTFGGYREVTIFRSGQFIAPLAKPNAQVAVADLLP